MTSSTKTQRPYGLWSSPISAISLSRGMSFSDVAWDESGALVWREGRSDRAVLVVQPADQHAARDLNSDYGARARVGYGGGDFGVAKGQVYFVEADSGRIYRQPLTEGTARPLFPGFGGAAAPTISPDGRWLVFVHSYEGQDALAIGDTEGRLWPAKLAAGRDFYMQPAWHPDSSRLAYVAWDHPQMPWDGTQLVLVTLSQTASGLPTVSEEIVIAGDDQTSIFQPQFSPDGRYLVYASDTSGWWQLYIYDLETKEQRQLTHTLAEHAEPAWGQGQRSFGFSPDGRLLYFIRNQDAMHSLWQVDVAAGIETRLGLDARYTALEQLAVGPQGHLALIASGAVLPERVIVFDPAGGEKVIRRSTAENLPPSAYIAPAPLTWKGLDGGDVYGLYYAPQSEKFESTGKPGLIIYIHGGPTGQSLASFNLAAQFFATRGYGYLIVNYRGSTGYGRAYRNMLRGNWGIYDVQDAVSGAQALSAQGLVDEKKIVIMGGSAGGFTVLKAIEDYPGFFKAAICSYGVTNQFTLAAETHKFEAHYSDSLLGVLPEAADVYRQRSPIFFVDRIKDPIAVFQGQEDVVVPRSQADELVASLQRRGVEHIYHLYPGEGHGFRKAETIEHFYKTVDKFLQQYVVFA